MAEKIEEPVSISVVIPTCDRLDYLNESLDSVLDQSLRAHEILIVDNSQTPIKKLQIPFDERIKIIRGLPKFGVSQARNLGASLSTGDYISFLDDDDLWDENYLRQISQDITNNRPDIIIGKLYGVESKKELKRKNSDFNDRKDFFLEIYYRNPGITGSNTTVKRSVFFEHSGYDPELTTGQDKALILDLVLKNKSFVRSQHGKVYYRIETDGTRQMDAKKWKKGSLRFLFKYWNFMPIRSKVLSIFQIARVHIKSFTFSPKK